MKKIFLLSLLFAIVSCNQQKMEYPETKKDNIVDNYFGVEVSDPYRWLEDDRSEETAEWVKAENDLTFSYLDQIPYRKDIRDRLEKLWNFARMGTPFKKGDYYFYSLNNGLQNQNVMYKTTDLNEKGEIFLDPNTFSDDGTVALTNFSVSKDAKYVGYGIARAGSDWNEFLVKDVETGELLPDQLQWIKFSTLAWYKNGFFYSRYEKPSDASVLSGLNENNKLYYHVVGTSQEQDKLIYEDPENPGWSFRAQVSEDEKYLIISVVESTSGNGLYFKDLTKKSDEIQKVVEDFESDYYFIGAIEDQLYFLTNHDAPMYKLITIDPQNPSMENWKNIVDENENQVLKSCSFAKANLILEYEKDARSLIEIYSQNGEFIRELELPGIGSLAGLSSKEDSNEVFYSYTSFNVPTEVYSYDTESFKSELIFRPEVDFDVDNYVTEQIFYESKDGTKVPMFVVHKKGLKLDGKRPTLLYGYGGFNITYTPSFSVNNLILLENDGVYVLANIRGGGEYGEKWHEAGTLLNKQNVFDDFISAAEYLIDNKYTSQKRLAIYGGSNGGLLVGAVTNQRPDLFAVAMPAVGVMDMLRFHKFTIGHYWVSDYGSSENEEQFHYLKNYSPIHNISEEAKYPAILVTTADHDDRVVPAHSFKYIATLQEKYKGKNPVLIRIETNAGHGAGKPISKTIDEYADKWAFTFYNMKVTPIYGKK
ncbi:MAG: prolyl oligopeptidase family serine peptidase [Bacteroidales bacterium]|nr:prolyl oligopeptidase family serine peptidase [Bacteroidales bacterium]MCF8389246.1 prolyl oligopeptidase family serine peptidase [Bacteroidales bacterium]